MASRLFLWLELHTDHEPGGRSEKLLIRKGREAQR